MQHYLQVGKIVATHGIKGWVKAMPLTDNPERFKALKNVTIQKNNVNKEMVITQTNIQANTVLIKFEHIDDMEAAAELKDYYLIIPRSDAVKLPPSSYFICDIEGCKVVTKEGQYLGEIIKVIQTGANDVYHVQGDREYLIPALKSIILTVDLTEKVITVELPEGLA